MKFAVLSLMLVIGGVGSADPLEPVMATGIAEVSGLFRCPELELEAVESAKQASVDKARELCSSPEVYPLRSWEVTSACEETTCCMGEATYTLKIYAFTEFLCR
ncbi:MAG: hypothetical protein IT288_03765 [Bdellovibrionales bacterium]|nr:hypothetical protein [Bdellovibrionales bacterium]